MALSDMTVRNAKATGKVYTLGDFDGLSLYVSEQGRRSWHFRYNWAGKQKRMSLGTYPEIGLREARSLRDQARSLLAQGVNPNLDRKQKRRAIRLSSQHSFRVIYQKWYEYRKLELEDGRNSTLSQIQRIFNTDVLPILGNIPIYDIKRTDLLAVTDKIESRKALTTAEKVRTWLNQLFRYALVKIDGLEVNPASDLDVVAMPKSPVRHNPFLRLSALPAFLQKLRDYSGNITTQLGIRLLILTGVRTGELRLATHDQFDLDQGLWIIPALNVKQLKNEMRKSGKHPQDIPDYIVPLSFQATEVVRYLINDMKPLQRYLLSHRNDQKKRISENTLNSALKRMGYSGLLTGHGIRGTISTALNEVGYPRAWVDSQLSHSDPHQVSAAYNHALYVEPRRKMMQDWANRLDLLEQGRVDAASEYRLIRIDDIPVGSSGVPLDSHENFRELNPSSVAMPMALYRLPAAPVKTISSFHAIETELSGLQRERQDMLLAYDDPHNIPVKQFANLAGKSKDQINRELKAGKLFAISLGNKGRRVPDWQLEPVKQRFMQEIMAQFPSIDAWALYWELLRPRKAIQSHSIVESLTESNFQNLINLLISILESRLYFSSVEN